MNESLLKIRKEFKIFTLCNKFFSFTNHFDSSGGRVMKFTASGHCSLLIRYEVNVNIFANIFGIYWDNIRCIYPVIIKWNECEKMLKMDWKKEPASIALVPGLIPAGVEFFYTFFMQIKLIWHSKDYTCLGPHQWNVNIRIVSVTTSSRKKFIGTLTVSPKVYRLGGETDSAIRWRKRTSCDVGERPEEAGC